MIDTTENIRREMVNEINTFVETRESMTVKYGKVWNTSELSDDYEVKGFMAPFVVVRRKADGKCGSMMFTHSPRFYFSFQEE